MQSFLVWVHSLWNCNGPNTVHNEICENKVVILSLVFPPHVFIVVGNCDPCKWCPREGVPCLAVVYCSHLHLFYLLKHRKRRRISFKCQSTYVNVLIFVDHWFYKGICLETVINNYVDNYPWWALHCLCQPYSWTFLNVLWLRLK